MRLLTAIFTALLIPSASFGVTPEEVLRLVKERSLQVKSAKLGALQSSYQVEAIKRSFFPKVTLSGSFQELYPDLFGNWNQNYTIGGSVSAQPVNFQNFVQLKIGKTQVEASKYRVERELLSAAYQALKELYTLKAYSERVKLKEESLKAAEEIYKVAKEKYKKGLVMITDVLKARAQVSQTRGEVESLKAQYTQTFNALNEILDFALQPTEKPEVELKEEKQELNQRALIEEALTLRPELKEARERLKEASLQVELQKSSLRPSLTLSASANRTGSKFWPQTSTYSAGFTLNFPIFDSGLTKYRALSAKKGAEISAVEVKKVENSIKREVLDAIAQVNSSYEALRADIDFLEFSQKAYQRAFNEYKLGVSDIVALMQAFTNLKEAQDRMVTSLLNYNLALLNLKRATGELLKEVKR